jgi:glycosyltransferase involved in cell wall biosynthesis
MDRARPAIVVLSTLFPNPAQPTAGVFIRERMFRVGQNLPLTVLAPIPWFPLQGLIRYWRPNFRPCAPAREVQAGVEVLHPRFFSVPALLKRFDGLFLAVGILPTLLRLKRAGRLDVLDAHFGYPDGYAASLIGRWLKIPVAVTLRGTEVRHAAVPVLRRKLVKTLHAVQRVFSVSTSLKTLALSFGVGPDKVRVVGNGVDTSKFHPVPRDEARRRLGLPADASVLITVGGLTERKGFHRVIELMPLIRRDVPALYYLVVGGPSAEGDWGPRLRAQVDELGLQEHVRFLGSIPPDQLKWALGAADAFVLATRNEGWANVILESMACGVPVVATDVGGNREVICQPELGEIVPFGEPDALRVALTTALGREWDRSRLIAYAEENEWTTRVQNLLGEFRKLAGCNGTAVAGLPSLDLHETRE